MDALTNTTAVAQTPQSYPEAMGFFDALDVSGRARVAGWQQRVAFSRTLYEYAISPAKKSDDGDARLDELMRRLVWEWPQGLTKTRDYLVFLPTKGRASKYVDLTLHYFTDGVVVTVKGERQRVSFDDPNHV